MKRVAIILDQMKLPAWNKVIDMHDEAQWEIPDTQRDQLLFAKKVQESFELANEFYNLRCPQEPDVKFGHNWSETH